MARCELDHSVERRIDGTFQYPLGVYPVEELTPKPGYVVEFEPADGGDEDEDFESWPDRYMFDIVVSAERLQPLCRSLLSMLSSRVYPILDFLGHDAYREIDPYVAAELVGLDRLMDGIRRYREFLYEDGLCGFGAYCEEPFTYFFVDEHKIVTVRVEPAWKERVERILSAFDLEPTPDAAGPDSASHEHRSVLATPNDRPELLGPEEIVERLADDWSLQLNIDAEGNVDEAGEDLGVTGWRCRVRVGLNDSSPLRYAEILIAAGSLGKAEELAMEGAERLLPRGVEAWAEQVLVSSDRMTPGDLARLLGTGSDKAGTKQGRERILRSRLLE